MRFVIAISLLISFGSAGAFASPIISEPVPSGVQWQSSIKGAVQPLGSSDAILLAKKKKTDSNSDNTESSSSDDSDKKDQKKESGAGKESSGSTENVSSKKEGTGSSKESAGEKSSSELDKKNTESTKESAGAGASAVEKLKGSKTFSGNASWYGIPFHGHKTASGEIFNMNKCSAAHLTLPLPTKVLVEDPRTGNAVLVKVNDRGPYVKTRVMDLSREAARELGTLPRGVAFIDVTVLESPNRARKTQ